MNSNTNWLSQLIELTDFDGDFGMFLEAVYQVFRHDFLLTHPQLGTKTCRPLKTNKIEGKEESFWHIITRTDSNSLVTEEIVRYVNMRRCERIRWPRSLIEHVADKTRIRIWSEKRQRDTRLLIAASDFSYVVVLIEKQYKYLLLTAYYAEQEFEKRKLKNRYERAVKHGLASPL